MNFVGSIRKFALGMICYFFVCFCCKKYFVWFLLCCLVYFNLKLLFCCCFVKNACCRINRL